jgi:hypothetical protein
MGREIYGALVRFSGTLLLVFALFDLWHIIMKLLGLDATSHYSISTDLFAAAGYFVFGCVVLIGARSWSDFSMAARMFSSFASFSSE